MPYPQSQSFSRSYGPNLPTSLTYIILSTRGCSPWRPDAVMSTTEGANTGPKANLHRIFTGRHERTGHPTNEGALPHHQPYLRLNRFQGINALRRKENSSQGSCWRLRLRLCCHALSTSRFGNINPIPFRQAGPPKWPLPKRSYPVS